MRARTIREGSVGLLILVGLGLIGFLILWIQGIDFNNRTYRFWVLFEDTVGMQEGAQVRYRGVPVGQVTAIQPQSNRVEVQIEIEDGDLHIPDDVSIQANQAGFLGETSIDIYPRMGADLTDAEIASNNPLSEDCNSNVLVCAGDVQPGDPGVNFNELIRSTIALSDQFTDPELFSNIQDLTRNSSNAAEEVAQLTQEVTTLVKLFQAELGPLSNSAISVANSVSRAADEISVTANRTNALLDANESALTTTLNNISNTSTQVRVLLEGFEPLATSQGELVQNLQVLTANAAATAENLENLTGAISDPTTILMLQQTLDSARATFENMQKITADLDELTGDPELRDNIRDLIYGFSDLVSFTDQLEEQMYAAQQTTSGSPGETPIAFPSGDKHDAEKLDLSILDSADSSMTFHSMPITNSIGERVQVAFPLIRPVDENQTTNPRSPN